MPEFRRHSRISMLAMSRRGKPASRAILEEGHPITRAIFEKNLAGKIHLPAFTNDIPQSLPN